MKVQILATGKYRFPTPRKMSAREYQAGDIVEYGKDYANYLIAQGLAQDVATIPVKVVTVEVEKPVVTDKVTVEPEKPAGRAKRGYK